MARLIRPKQGYDTEEKGAWRDWVYSHVGGTCIQTGRVVTGNVLCMPSIDGAEVEHLLARGFSEDQIHVADHNPAVVATLKKRWRGIHTYGVDVHRACERIAAKGTRLVAANLDYCGRMSASVLRSVALCFHSGALDGAHVFVNILRGREDAAEIRIASLSLDPRHAHAARVFLSNPSGWWESDALTPTENDVRRVTTLSRIASRTWARAFAYRSPNGQSFITTWFPNA
jgi:hypothetical protein